MRGLLLARGVLAAAGVAAAAVGVREVVSALHSPGSVVPVAVRWVAGPLLLDLVVLPLLAVVGVLLRRRLSGPWLRPVAAAGVVSLLLTVVAVPFLVPVGRRADNPTLLDRPYAAGWLGLLAVVWGLAVVAGFRGRSASGARSG